MKKYVNRFTAVAMAVVLLVSVMCVNIGLTSSATSDLDSVLINDYESSLTVAGDLVTKIGWTARGSVALSNEYAKSGTQSVKTVGSVDASANVQQLMVDYVHTEGQTGISFWVKAQTAVTFDVRVRNYSEDGTKVSLQRVTLEAGEEKEIIAWYEDAKAATGLGVSLDGAAPATFDPMKRADKKVQLILFFQCSKTAEKVFYVDDVAEVKIPAVTETPDSVLVNDYESSLTDANGLTTRIGWATRGSAALSNEYAKSGTQSVKAVGSVDASANVQQLMVTYLHTEGQSGISFWVKAQTAVTFDVRVRNQGDDSTRVTIQRVTLAAGEEKEVIAWYEDAKESIGLGASLDSAAPKAFDPAKNANKQIDLILFFQCSNAAETVFYVDDVTEANKSSMGVGPTGEAVFPATSNEVIADFEGATHPAYLTDGFRFEIAATDAVAHEGQKALNVKAKAGAAQDGNYLKIPYRQMADKEGFSFWFKATKKLKFDVRVFSGDTAYTLRRVEVEKGFEGVIKAYYADATVPVGFGQSNLGAAATFAPAAEDKLEFALFFQSSNADGDGFYVDTVKQYKESAADNKITAAYENSDDIKYYKETLEGEMIQDFETDADLTFVTVTGGVAANVAANTNVFNTGAKSIKVISDQSNGKDGVLSFTYDKEAEWNSFSFWMATGQTLSLDIKVALGNEAAKRVLKKTVQAEYSGVVIVPFLADMAAYAGEVTVDISVNCSSDIAVMWFDSIMQNNYARPIVADTEKKGDLSDDVAAKQDWSIGTTFEKYADNAALFEEWDFVAESDWLTGSFVLDRGNQYRGYNSLRMDYDFSYTENPAKQNFSVQGPLQHVNTDGLSFYLRADEEVYVDVSVVDDNGHYSILRLPAKQYDGMVTVDFNDIIGGNSNYGRIDKNNMMVRLTVSPASDSLKGTIYVDDISYTGAAGEEGSQQGGEQGGEQGGANVPATGVKEPLFLYIPAILCAAVLVVVSWKRQLVK